jgi:hypothetical protein
MTAPDRSRTITWSEPVSGLREFATMSGLDYLRHVMLDRAREAPIGATLGFRAVRFEHGLACSRQRRLSFITTRSAPCMVVSPRHCSIRR